MPAMPCGNVGRDLTDIQLNVMQAAQQGSRESVLAPLSTAPKAGQEPVRFLPCPQVKRSTLGGGRSGLLVFDFEFVHYLGHIRSRRDDFFNHRALRLRIDLALQSDY